MDSILSIRVFEWRDVLWGSIDRVGSSDHRKHAPRTRVATWRLPTVPGVSEELAFLWLLDCLNDWVKDGCPDRRWTDREAVPASPSGDHRGARVAADDTPNEPLPSKTEPPADKKAGAVGVSDGLWPEGLTPHLF
jgi:hypothetical protein